MQTTPYKAHIALGLEANRQLSYNRDHLMKGLSNIWFGHTFYHHKCGSYPNLKNK